MLKVPKVVIEAPWKSMKSNQSRRSKAEFMFVVEDQLPEVGCLSPCLSFLKMLSLVNLRVASEVVNISKQFGSPSKALVQDLWLSLWLRRVMWWTVGPGSGFTWRWCMVTSSALLRLYMSIYIYIIHLGANRHLSIKSIPLPLTPVLVLFKGYGCCACCDVGCGGGDWFSYTMSSSWRTPCCRNGSDWDIVNVFIGVCQKCSLFMAACLVAVLVSWWCLYALSKWIGGVICSLSNRLP